MANDSKTPFSNYKSAALDQLSYAGVPHTKAVFSELIQEFVWAGRLHQDDS
jgi:hypothetical protein